MQIERLGMEGPRPPATPAVMIEAMDWAGEFVNGLMRDWPDHPYQYTPARYIDWPNQFPPDPADSAASDARRGRAAANMMWELSPDEALILEFAPPDSFWMLTNMGAFMSSLDYLYRPVSYTPARTKVDGDGKVRLVVAHADPGVHNWMDTQGLVRGNITWRNLMSQAQTGLSTRVVKAAELDAALPADTARVTPAERTAQMHERFDAIRRRYSLLGALS
jgi:hypothetical protein